MTFAPPLALASLSGRSDARWARAAAPYAGAAFLGGIATDERTRTAAEVMVGRDRTEFLPPDPFEFVDGQFDALADASLTPAINVRAVSSDPIRRMAKICGHHDAILEVNAHCRQVEMCDVGAGETLLRDTDRLARMVRAGVAVGASVSVKVRAEVPGVDLPQLAGRLDEAGADYLHVDAMDSEGVIAPVVANTGCVIIANNGVRDERTVREYLAYGADAVSVGRASDDPAILARVHRALERWFDKSDDVGESPPRAPRDSVEASPIPTEE